MCLSSVYSSPQHDKLIMEYVSKIQIEDNKITLTDVLGDEKTVYGTLKFADLTCAVVEIDCLEDTL